MLLAFIPSLPFVVTFVPDNLSKHDTEIEKIALNKEKGIKKRIWRGKLQDWWRRFGVCS